MKVLAITQARYGSTRFPAKILKKINGVTLLEIHICRILQSKLINKLKIATTNEEGARYIVDIAKKLGVEYYQGSVDDVLDRFCKTAESENPDYIVRLTSDCPLIDPSVVDDVIRFTIDHGYDYVATDSNSYPDGLDVEVFKYSVLKRACEEAKMKSEREHVTPYIWKNGTAKGGQMFKTYYIPCSKGDFSRFRITIDEMDDFELIKILIEHLGYQSEWVEYIDYLSSEKGIFNINNNHIRNEGYLNSLNKEKNHNKMGTGSILYKKAKMLIPGGTMLLSKRPEMFLPEFWPAYFSRAKGCKVWDLDGREYIDVSLMGVGTNTLGYGNEEVDEAVIRTIRNGNLSTLNCPEEVELAEKLIELNPWADMVRFARTGGEINAIAVRIARVASGKDKVAVCGYHGWHDWYLSANLGNEERLAGHLLPGLEPAGVPRVLQDMTIPFSYNNFQELANIVNNHDIGVIKMEVCRNVPPKDDFLQRIRQLASERKIILIFDECSSGFRETFGGLYKKYGVEPDMAIFSKTMGNGYAISAVVGKRYIMEAAQKTFISSTFWTERVGPTAAIAALKVMKRIKSWDLITKIGLENKKRWQQMADKYGLSITQWGIPALAGFTFNSEKNLAYKTYITQEMLSRGYLAGNCMYTCVCHTNDILDGYFHELERLFSDIRDFEDGRDVEKSLKVPICHAGFKRLN